jgi:hypothetical protein
MVEAYTRTVWARSVTFLAVVASADNHGVCSQSWTGTTSIEFAGEPSMIFELTAT